MKIKHSQFGFEVKALDETGSFAGYGAVFGNTDLIRDVVMPGAFTQSLAAWKARGTLPPILWQHKSDQPLGPFTAMSEETKGLYAEGQLLIKDVKKAREAYALMKAKAIRGMSIGYKVVDEEYDAKQNVNRLKSVDLYEVSIVTFPMNTEATATQIKSILAGGRMPTLAEFEASLRDEGWSRTQAKIIAGEGLRGLLKQRDADEGQLDEKRVESMLALFNTPIQF